MNALNFELPECGLVFVAGRTAAGKSRVMLGIAKELQMHDKKCVLLLADRTKVLPHTTYCDGKTRRYPNDLQQAEAICPSITVITADAITSLSPEGWKAFVDDIAKHEMPDVIFVNALSESYKKVSVQTVKALYEAAQKNGVLIVAEIKVNRSFDRKKDRRPALASVRCAKRAFRYVEQIVFVYREGDDSKDEDFKIRTEATVLSEVFIKNKKGISRFLCKKSR